MNGYKTYLVSAITVVWAIYGMLSGHLDTNAGVQLISQSALVAALRHGVSTGA